MNASWNQKANLFTFAKDQGLKVIHEELRVRNITEQPMSVEKYKDIRNAILFNQPGKALELINRYPVQFEKVDVAPEGGEL